MDKELDFDFGELLPQFLEDGDKQITAGNLSRYAGPERRNHDRRSANDRRARLRFQPGKCIDRRDVPERRKTQ